MERSDEQEVVDELRGGVDAVSAATSGTQSAVASASQSNSDHPHGQPVSPKSSALSSTLAHILNPTPPPSGGSRSPIIISSPTEFTIASGSNLQRPFLSSKAESPPPPANLPHTDAEPLSSYSCPICFFPPTNATLTPCGHVCCGSCLFTAVKTMTQRGAAVLGASEARCPVCRAEIPDWDGRGGGVIGLRSRFVFSL
ncbi:hypothetical protein GGX14DRAFT_348099 [Mycena pura]|uniref:RING-type domain-containing protein n=1 Tax=Mycena pura TaxID=153505 RepID=A0AAD6YRB5_9AGAR|nr:hypothetical protein GGX14DRAFT_348099 [Mycena pura]